MKKNKLFRAIRRRCGATFAVLALAGCGHGKEDVRLRPDLAGFLDMHMISDRSAAQWARRAGMTPRPDWDTWIEQRPFLAFSVCGTDPAAQPDAWFVAIDISSRNLNTSKQFALWLTFDVTSPARRERGEELRRMTGATAERDEYDCKEGVVSVINGPALVNWEELVRIHREINQKFGAKLIRSANE